MLAEPASFLVAMVYHLFLQGRLHTQTVLFCALLCQD